MACWKWKGNKSTVVIIEDARKQWNKNTLVAQICVLSDVLKGFRPGVDFTKSLNYLESYLKLQELGLALNFF